MKKPALFTMIALALCAAAARAQTDANQLDEAPATSDLARRIERLTAQPGHDLQGEGHWMSASAGQKGRIEAVIEGEEGEPLWYLDAFTTEYVPGVGPSSRFEYGGVYGTLYALDGTEAAPILVQGEWARHGRGSPNGSLTALVFRNAAHPQNVDVLGTLTGTIQFFGDGGADGGPSIAISGVQGLPRMNASGAASGVRAQTAPGLVRAQERAQDPPATARGLSMLGQLATARAASGAPSDAGSPSHLDRVGTCGTVDGGERASAPGQMIQGHEDVGTGGAGAMQIDGLVRLVYRVLV